jgi:hypothetical protein
LLSRVHRPLDKIDEYDKYLQDPENFTKWWKGGSPIKDIRKMLLE